jgi:hypothetical protein
VAAQVSMHENKPAHSAVDGRLGSPTSTLAIIEPRLHSKSNFGSKQNRKTEVLVLVVL